MLGIGGGGDVVGALATARTLEAAGAETILGGVAWERIVIDPRPGPRPSGEITGGRPLADCVMLAGPDTSTIDGVRFAEAHMARFLGRETLLIDVHGGPEAIAAGLAQAVGELDADLVVCMDVGGDVLGEGSEPGLASPLCDAVMLAAAARLAELGVDVLAGVFGPCCDGELTAAEMLDRLAALGAAGALVGCRGMSDAIADELERATEVVPTEASAQAIRCARGEVGWTTIRRGRRKLFLSPLGALSFYFDPSVAVHSAAPLAAAVQAAGSLDEANDALHDLGVRTELDFERSQMEA